MDSEEKPGRGLPPDPDYLNPKPRRITRRKALTILGVGSAAGVALTAGARALRSDPASTTHRPDRTTTTADGSSSGEPTTTEPPPATETMAKWSEPDTWGGKVPGSGDVALVDKPVVLDVDAQVAGVDIQPGGELVYDPEQSHTLTSSGNVVVHGALRMRPTSASIQHVLTFAGIDESRYVGDHSDTPLDTDVGVWVLHSGVLDLMGAQKKAWTNLEGEALAGTNIITVTDANGWQVGDEIVVTPTEAPEDQDHWTHHDRRTITAVAGNKVTIDKPLEFNHPEVTVRDGVLHSAEVLNLGRNVRIEGEPDARTHVMLLHAMAPQAMGWVALRHVGPQGVVGRYPLHFHMCDDAVRGSTVDGMTITDAGNHAFVVHLSNGVSLRDCISHDTIDDAYWWDQGVSGDGGDSNPSHDVVYERCVASYVKIHDRPHGTAAFMMGAGHGNVARGCVAVGVEAKSDSGTAYRWGSRSNGLDPWVFEDNIAHNNPWSAIYYWQNNVIDALVDRFTCYHLGGAGILAGAYTNIVSYRDCTIYGTRGSGVFIHATPSSEDHSASTIHFDGMHVDPAGMSDYAVEISEHVLDHGRVTEIGSGTFRGGSKAQVGIPKSGEFAQLYNFTDCTFEGNPFWLHDNIKPESKITVTGGNLGSIEVHPSGGAGQAQPEWNATSSAT